MTSLGALPLQSACTGTPADYEVEGDDYDRRTHILRVEVIPPPGCDTQTTVYEYRSTGSQH